MVVGIFSTCWNRTSTSVPKYDNVKVEVVSTKPSMAFFDVAAVQKAGARVWRDEDEWGEEVRLHTYIQIRPILKLEIRVATGLAILSCTLNYVVGQTSFSLHLVRRILCQRSRTAYATT